VLNIPSNQALAHFLDKLHTKLQILIDTENLNYSAAGLVSTFKKYFPTPESTAGYARQPKKDSK
jgi:predicted chitinase